MKQLPKLAEVQMWKENPWSLTLSIVGAGPAGLSGSDQAHAVELRPKGVRPPFAWSKKARRSAPTCCPGPCWSPARWKSCIPDWQERGAPLNTPVTGDTFYFYTSDKSAIKLPGFAIPRPTHNHGNFIVSMGNVCRWLAEQAEALGVEIYPGFAAAEVLFHDQRRRQGYRNGRNGRRRRRTAERTATCPAWNCTPAYTVFAEGCRGHLGKQLIAHFALDEGKDPQHYGLGIKEVWKVSPEKHQEGLVVHGIGWPLSESGLQWRRLSLSRGKS